MISLIHSSSSKWMSLGILLALINLVSSHANVVCRPGTKINIKTGICTNCPMGKYSKTNNSKGCYPCPKGTTTSRAGSALCDSFESNFPVTCKGFKNGKGTDSDLCKCSPTVTYSCPQDSFCPSKPIHDSTSDQLAVLKLQILGSRMGSLQ